MSVCDFQHVCATVPSFNEAHGNLTGLKPRGVYFKQGYFVLGMAFKQSPFVGNIGTFLKMTVHANVLFLTLL